MARRTKAEIRAAKIAELARKKRELDDLLRAEQREAAKEAKAAFVASRAALGKAVAASVIFPAPLNDLDWVRADLGVLM